MSSCLQARHILGTFRSQPSSVASEMEIRRSFKLHCHVTLSFTMSNDNWVPLLDETPLPPCQWYDEVVTAGRVLEDEVWS